MYIIRATNMCLRGIKWRAATGPGFEDGGGLPLC